MTNINIIENIIFKKGDRVSLRGELGTVINSNGWYNKSYPICVYFDSRYIAYFDRFGKAKKDYGFIKKITE